MKESGYPPNDINEKVVFEYLIDVIFHYACMIFYSVHIYVWTLLNWKEFVLEGQ